MNSDPQVPLKQSDFEQSLLTLEQSLAILVEKVNEQIGQREDSESTCTVYLYDFRRKLYVLRASTKPTRYLGIDSLAITPKIMSDFAQHKLENLGLTKYVILLGEACFCNNVLENKIYSCHRKYKLDIAKWEENHYCEYTDSELDAFLAAPIYFRDPKERSKIRNMPDGVIRVVRKKQQDKPSKPFSETDKKDLVEIVRNETIWIESCTFLSQLIEIGTYTDIIRLCKQASVVLRNLLKGKGCSIFLLDETEKGENNDTRYYKCYGTTGLVIRPGGDKKPFEIEDPLASSEAWYTLSARDLKQSPPAPRIPMTMGVVRARTCAFIDDIYDKNFLDNVFPKNWSIQRDPGVGKVCESTILDGEYKKAESILFAPMFYREPNNRSIDVLGVVRIVRPKGHGIFTTLQKHMFVSLVERLAKAITALRFREFIDKLSTISDKELLSSYLVSNIPKFVSATKCVVYEMVGEKPILLSKWTINDAQIVSNPEIEKLFTDSVRKVYDREGRVVLGGNQDEHSKNDPIEKKLEEFGQQFVGIPIKNESLAKKPIGIVAILRDLQLPSLGEDDLSTLERISGHLPGKFFELSARAKRQQIIDQIIPSPLRSQIQSLYGLTCGPILKECFENLDTVDILENAIIEILPRLWELYDPDHANRPIYIWDRFHLFNKEILPSVPHYRDHFVHQFIVFLLGAIILAKLKRLPSLAQCYPAYRDLPLQEHNAKAERAWVITSLFHDVAYPLETSNTWFWNIIKAFVGEDSHHEMRTLPVDTILYNPDYIDSIDQIVSFHRELGRHEQKLRRVIMDVLRKDKDGKGSSLDHGIMGALLLLGNSHLEVDEVLPAASAIALHNKLGDMPGVNSVAFETHPLAFLLIYCDLLHEWNRDLHETKAVTKNKFPLLKDFTITDNLDELASHGLSASYIKLIREGMDRGDEKCVFANIKVEARVKEKWDEARRKFDKLRAKEICFIAKINNKVFYTISRP